jgi:hypothetical protein
MQASRMFKHILLCPELIGHRNDQISRNLKLWTVDIGLTNNPHRVNAFLATYTTAGSSIEVSLQFAEVDLYLFIQFYTNNVFFILNGIGFGAILNFIDLGRRGDDAFSE